MKNLHRHNETVVLARKLQDPGYRVVTEYGMHFSQLNIRPVSVAVNEKNRTKVFCRTMAQKAGRRFCGTHTEKARRDN